jgi:exodeoxyribonuclease VII small subunit
MPKVRLNEALEKLEAITRWFETQENADVEEGLKKIKEGAALIKESKARLKEVENEFEEVKKELEEE